MSQAESRAKRTVLLIDHPIGQRDDRASRKLAERGFGIEWCSPGRGDAPAPGRIEAGGYSRSFLPGDAFFIPAGLSVDMAGGLNVFATVSEPINKNKSRVSYCEAVIGFAP